MKHIIPSAMAALLLCGNAAFAQTNPAPTIDPKGCAPHERLQTDGKAPEVRTGEPLSDKLARTDGVLCPPNVDPEIRVPAPRTGSTMPVIPPPGSPGTDQSGRPK